MSKIVGFSWLLMKSRAPRTAIRRLKKAGLKIDKFDYENMLILLITGLEMLKEVDE